jgi:hypothetical protein
MPQACLREPEAPRTWAVVAKATQTQPAHKRRCRMRKRGEQAASTRVLSLDAIWAPKLLEKWPSSAHTDPAGPGIVLASGLRSAADVSGSPEQSGPVGETRQHGAQPRPRGTVRTATRLGSYKRHRLVAAGSLDSQAKRHSGYTSTESEAQRCFDNETGNSFEKSAPSESHCGVSCSGTTENDTCRSESLLRHIPEDTNNERCSIIEKAGSGMIVQPARKQPMCGHSGRISRHQCADDNRNGIGRNEYLKSAAQTLPSTPFSSANDSLDAGNVKSALNTNAASLCASCSGSLLFRQYAVSDGYASSAESLSLSSEEHTRDAGDVQVPEHTQCRDKHRTRQAADEPAETSCLQHNLSSSMAETTNEHELSWADLNHPARCRIAMSSYWTRAGGDLGLRRAHAQMHSANSALNCSDASNRPCNRIWRLPLTGTSREWRYQAQTCAARQSTHQHLQRSGRRTCRTGLLQHPRRSASRVSSATRGTATNG